LLAATCEGRVGAVLSVEASRIARNGREWHTLLDFCGLVNTLIIDEDGIAPVNEIVACLDQRRRFVQFDARIDSDQWHPAEIVLGMPYAAPSAANARLPPTIANLVGTDALDKG
jgi:hypothetical protein